MQPKVIATVVAVSLFSLSVQGKQQSMQAAPKIEPGKVLVALFAQTCLSSATALDGLADRLDNSLKRLQPEPAKFYLGQAAGAAWAMNTAAGPHIVAIKGSECIVYSAAADTDGGEKAFEEIIKAFRADGHRVSRIKDDRPGPPRESRTRQLGYAIQANGAAERLHLMFTAFESASSPVRATVSLTHYE